MGLTREQAQAVAALRERKSDGRFVGGDGTRPPRMYPCPTCRQHLVTSSTVVCRACATRNDVFLDWLRDRLGLERMPRTIVPRLPRRVAVAEPLWKRALEARGGARLVARVGP